MQSIWTARVGEAKPNDEGKESAETRSLPLVEYLLTVSPQALYHATNLYTKAARVLAGKGILVYPDTQLHHLLILVPASMHSEKGLQTILSWIMPLLPAQPAPKKSAAASAKQASKAVAAAASAAPWTVLLKYVNRAGYADEVAAASNSNRAARTPVDAGQREGWVVEVEMKPSGSGSRGGKSQESDAVSDAIIQACINHAVRLLLNSQGWALVGSRFLRIPANLEPSHCVPAIQLCLTLTQQSELTVFISSSLVRFNSVVSKATHSEDRYAEAIVRVLPELTEAQIQHVVGVASVGNSLGVDREMWFERHGITLPPSFLVVQVKLGVDDACYNFPTATYPLCCCLTSDLHPVNMRSHDEASKLKLAQDQTASIQEVLAILKGVRIVAPSIASGGTLINLLHSFEAHESDSLLQAIDPFANKRIASSETISADTGFQKASSLAVTAAADEGAAKSKRKFGVKLSIPQKRARGEDASSSSELSLAFVKATTQLPTAAPINFGSAWDAPKTAPVATAASSSKYAEDAEMRSTEEKPAKKAATAAATKKVASSAAKLSSASKPAASSSKDAKAAKKPRKETEAERAVRKAREKAEKAAAKAAAKAASKKRSASSKSGGWAADFQEAFAHEASNPSEAAATSAEFKLAMGAGVAPVAATAAAAAASKKAVS